MLNRDVGDADRVAEDYAGIITVAHGRPIAQRLRPQSTRFGRPR
jgi:hypothetical protein